MSFRGERIGLLEKVWAISASTLAILFSTMISTSILLGGLAARYRDGVFFLQQGNTIRPESRGRRVLLQHGLSPIPRVWRDRRSHSGGFSTPRDVLPAGGV